MEFNEVICKRRTSREWTDREVDFAAVKRAIAAGMKAPSWDHYCNWQFIVLHLRMTGGLLLAPADLPQEKHTHLVCLLSLIHI